MLQQACPGDFVIATGTSYELERFIEEAFNCVGLQWRDHVETNSELLRPTDLAVSRANPEKAKITLGWSARHCMPDVVRMMIEAENLRYRC